MLQNKDQENLTVGSELVWQRTFGTRYIADGEIEYAWLTVTARGKRNRIKMSDGHWYTMEGWATGDGEGALRLPNKGETKASLAKATATAQQRVAAAKAAAEDKAAATAAVRRTRALRANEGWEGKLQIVSSQYLCGTKDHELYIFPHYTARGAEVDVLDVEHTTRTMIVRDVAGKAEVKDVPCVRLNSTGMRMEKNGRYICSHSNSHLTTADSLTELIENYLTEQWE